jgi:hypothetical protein
MKVVDGCIHVYDGGWQPTKIKPESLLNLNTIPNDKPKKKDKSLTTVVRELCFGSLRAFITRVQQGDKGIWYVGHIYGMGDDDTSHWCVKRRKPDAVLRAMEKRFIKYNSNIALAVLD